MESNFQSGLAFLKSSPGETALTFMVPSALSNSVTREKVEVCAIAAQIDSKVDVDAFLSLDKYSSFYKMVRILRNVLEFIEK